MPNSPKNNEEKMMRVLNAWKMLVLADPKYGDDSTFIRRDGLRPQIRPSILGLTRKRKEPAK